MIDIIRTNGGVNGATEKHRIPIWPCFMLLLSFSLNFFVVIFIHIIITIFVQCYQVHLKLIYLTCCNLFPFCKILWMIESIWIWIWNIEILSFLFSPKIFWQKLSLALESYLSQILRLCQMKHFRVESLFQIVECCRWILLSSACELKINV